MQQDAKEHVVNGIEKWGGADNLDVTNAAKLIKENMDRQFGPSWHVIIGEAYSFDVTRQQNATLLMYYAGKFIVLCFKC